MHLWASARRFKLWEGWEVDRVTRTGGSEEVWAPAGEPRVCPGEKDGEGGTGEMQSGSGKEGAKESGAEEFSRRQEGNDSR